MTTKRNTVSAKLNRSFAYNMTRHHTSTESTDSNPPIEISRSRKFAAPLSLIIAFTGAIIATALAFADLKTATADNTVQLTKQEVRIEKLETVYPELVGIKKDVEWMRRTMEGRYNQRFDEPKIPNTK